MNEEYNADWFVPVHGYQWKQPTSKKTEQTDDWILSEAISPTETRGLRKAKDKRIDLLDLPAGLFLLFAHLDPTREGIQQFANQYGLLGLSANEQVNERETSSQPASRKGESLGEWRQQVEEMKDVVTLWDALQENDRQALGFHLHREATKPHFEQSPSTDGKETTYTVYFTSFCNWNMADDPVLPAANLVAKLVNKHLEPVKHSLQLRPDPKLGEDSLKLAPRFMPKTLYQAIWIQLAAAIAEGRSLKKCVECTRWFAVNPKAPQTKLEFCSDACRVRAYRKRQDLARQMAAAGKSFAVIAEKIGSDVDVIERWITGKKKK